MGDKADPRRSGHIASFHRGDGRVLIDFDIVQPQLTQLLRQLAGHLVLTWGGGQRGGARVALAANREIAEEALGESFGEWR